MAQPRVKEPQTHSKDPPPQTIILEPTPLITSFQREERSVSTPQNSPFQLLEPMPAETPRKSWPMFILGFFTPFIVWFLTMFVLDVTWELFGRRVSWWLADASCYALPLLYIGTLIYSFTKGSRSFGKGLLAAVAVPLLLIGGFILILFIEYG
tara:strand:+ start:1083 stop:1541 length:459 start_codon:yes stop_codon:yes gene_type:complete